jgi:uncharacterized protein (TIRG00374 family)
LLEKIKKKLFISLGVAGLIYLAFTIYADYNQVIFAFAQFEWFLIPLVLLLSFLNYISRFIKWDYYLSVLNVKIKKIDSFSIFMSGLIMSVTPGKMGELLKSYLVKQVTGEPISKTAPIILVERITDFLSLILIALIGAYIFDYGRMIVIIVGLFFILLVVIISNKTLSLKMISLLVKIKVLQKFLSSINSAYESSYILLKPKPLFLMSTFSLISWFLECLGYYIILINFKVDVSIIWASFSYAFATIVGAITMLPGGLGVTEGSLTFLLVENGLATIDVSVASTFIIRAATLWFAVLVGIISVLFYQKRYGRITVDNFNE